jgi:hypothetical protein
VVIGLAHQVMLPLAAAPEPVAAGALDVPPVVDEVVDEELLQAAAVTAATAHANAAWATRRPRPAV